MSDTQSDDSGKISRRCGTCGEEFAVAPGWNDYHLKVEKRMASGTGLSRMHFCSAQCAIKALEEDYV